MAHSTKLARLHGKVKTPRRVGVAAARKIKERRVGVAAARKIKERRVGVAAARKTKLHDPEALSEILLAWYDKNGRTLPWRAKHGQKTDPYGVWLSEIMLQQTTVAAVIPYYHKFLRLWPDLAALAKASQQEIFAAWAGLGYYRRAKLLHETAQLLANKHGGHFPNTENELRQLPGIGSYTAAAIAAIAFGRKANVIDGNVQRVMARLFRLKHPLSAADPLIRQHAETLVPQRRSGDYAQALMDLGAMICRPKIPRCGDCPWQGSCLAYAHGETELFPVRRAKPVRPKKYAFVFHLRNAKGEIWLRQRPAQGVLASMIELPSSVWQANRRRWPRQTVEILSQAPAKTDWQVAGNEIRHIFTHFELYLTPMVGRLRSGNPSGEGFWAAPDQVLTLALPSVMRKVFAAVAKRKMK
jgi:A/G-specific adenine glycosylase